MANRRPQNGGRRPDFVRNDRSKNFGGRGGVSPWQGGGGPGTGLPNLLPLAGGSTEATLALASNIINLLQPRQNPVPSLLDMPIRRDFGANMGRYDRGYVPNRMGNQGNFRRSGNYNRAGERMNNRKPSKPNDGPRQPNKNFMKKDADSKAKPVKESEQEDKNKTNSSEQSEVKEEDGDKKEGPKSRYDEIHQALLKCHICNKTMWDGRSFENHLNGRAHSIMMQKTAESYALTADTMRQEIKIREMKRTRKAGQQPSRDFYCAMCDMYAADGPIHRTTVGHRKLKKYLHPTCTSCHKEMPTRIELDEHRLTAEHLKVMQEKQEVISKPKPEVMVISTLSMELMYLRDDRQRWRRADQHGHGSRDRDGKEQDDEKKDQDGETMETDVKQEGDTEKKEEQLDSEKTVLDYKEGDDVANVTEDMFPAYSTERGVGRSFLSEFRCVQCKLCRKLLDSDETADVHLRTWRHHQLFLRLLTDKANANKQQETVEEPAQDGEPAQEGNKRTIDSEENGNWKRRKTTTDDGDLDDSEEINMKEEPHSEAEADAEMETEPNPDDLEDWADHPDDDKEIENGTEPDAEKPAEKEPSPPPSPEQQEPEPEPEPSPVPAPKPADRSPAPRPPRGQPTPRGRGTPRARGRGRARGRY